MEQVQNYYQFLTVIKKTKRREAKRTRKNKTCLLTFFQD